MFLWCILAPYPHNKTLSNVPVPFDVAAKTITEHAVAKRNKMASVPNTTLLQMKVAAQGEIKPPMTDMHRQTIVLLITHSPLVPSTHTHSNLQAHSDCNTETSCMSKPGSKAECHPLLWLWRLRLESTQPDRTGRTGSEHLCIGLVGWTVSSVCLPACFSVCAFLSLFPSCPIFLCACIVLRLTDFFSMKTRWIFNDPLWKLFQKQKSRAEVGGEKNINMKTQHKELGFDKVIRAVKMKAS